MVFLHPHCSFPCAAGGDCETLSTVPAPDKHGADFPAAAARDGHAEAAGCFRAAGDETAEV